MPPTPPSDYCRALDTVPEPRNGRGRLFLLSRPFALVVTATIAELFARLDADARDTALGT